MSDTTLLPLPDKMELVHDRDAMIIRHTWFSIKAILLIPFALFWNGFMVVWMYKALSDGIWVMAAFGSIHALVGIGLIYFCIACFLNKTDVSIDPNYLTVRHYPVPWMGNQKIRVHEIKQLYTKEHITRNKNSTSVSYRVYAILNNLKEKKLISNLDTLSQGKYIEREIEAVLGLEDIQVAGEVR